MADFQYFISEAYLKANSPIDGNVDGKLLKNAMRDCQETFIRDILGTALYDKIWGDIEAATLTGNYESLVKNYIAPCLVNYIVSDSMLPMTFKMMNKSVSTRESENGAPVNVDDLTRIENKYKDKAEFYGNRLRKYMEANTSLFPEFLNPGSQIDTVRPSDPQVYGGLYLEGDDECFSNYDFP